MREYKILPIRAKVKEGVAQRRGIKRKRSCTHLSGSQAARCGSGSVNSDEGSKIEKMKDKKKGMYSRKRK